MGDNRTDFDHAIPMSDSTASLQEADLAQTSASGDTSAATGQASGGTTDARQAIKDGAGKLGQQATDRIRTFADDGKARAGGALDQLSQMLTDAAGQVDDKLGGQYGDYARQAASTVQGFSDQVKNKDVDELLEDVRVLVRKSPAIAIGAAAAVGFVLARLVQAGVDDQRSGVEQQGGGQA
jgi:ElaB/YqjD/DUF883 family membrane-anchored ribosome-binding protein